VRILVVNWLDRANPQAGGAEVHLHAIFGRLAAAGHEVHLVCSGWRGAPPDAEVDGVQVHRVSSRYGFALVGARAFRSWAARLLPDVVVEDVNKIPLNLPRWWGGPFVLIVPHLFGTTAFRELPWPLATVVWGAELTMPRIYGRAAVHAISEATRDDLVARGFRRDHVRVIYPGVDTGYYVPDPGVRRETTPTFLYVGRLKRYKQLDVAIRAMAALERRGSNAKLWVAGMGDDRARLERVARQAGAGRAVEFLGFVSEERKLALYRKAWAVVFPSLKEGWGITNVEAAACGTAAVAADNSALRESVRDGDTGFLVPTGDAAALAAALDRLAASPALVERLGRNARAYAETFSWERCARESESHLIAAAAGRPRGQE
jgi:glycosyltransferase involved in cell wall biosynthesis